MGYVECDMSELKSFFKTMQKYARGDFKKDLELFLEGLGFEFLRILEDEIIRLRVMDTRLLLASFEKGNGSNVWKINKGNLTLEVGTNVEYAKFVNDGHWTNPEGVASRFIPGDVVIGSDGKVKEFIYNPGANTGITLKQKWVEGSHYWESALQILNQIYPEMLDNKLQQWLDSYFGA